jgi:alkylhydroperoxidase family enzyme
MSVQREVGRDKTASSVLPVSLERLSELHPEGAAALAHMIEEAWKAIDPAVLARCRRRIRELLGVEEPVPHDEPDAHLALTEQFVRSVSGVTDAQIEALRRLGDDASVYAFVAALYVVDMSERLDLVALATFARSGDAAGAAATAEPVSVSAPQACASSVAPRINVPDGSMSLGIPLDAAMDAFAAAAMRSTTVDPYTTEVVRQRCARFHDCRTCGSLRMPEAQALGLDEDVIERIASGGGYGLGDRARAALRVADAMIVDPAGISPGLYEELQPSLTDAQIAELAVDVVKWSKQKLLVALRLEVPPWQGNALLSFDERGEPVISLP